MRRFRVALADVSYLILLLPGILLLAQVLKNKILGAVGHACAEGKKVADMLVAFSLHQVYMFVHSLVGSDFGKVTLFLEPLLEALAFVWAYIFILRSTRVPIL